MLFIKCPYCGEPRPEVEFQYAGEGRLVRPPGEAVSDAQWAAYLYTRANPRGAHVERWRHTHGCARFFNAERDTASDAFARTWPVGATPDVQDEGAQDSGAPGSGGDQT